MWLPINFLCSGYGLNTLKVLSKIFTERLFDAILMARVFHRRMREKNADMQPMTMSITDVAWNDGLNCKMLIIRVDSLFCNFAIKLKCLSKRVFAFLFENAERFRKLFL